MKPYDYNAHVSDAKKPLTVGEFKDLGVIPAIGDKYTNVQGGYVEIFERVIEDEGSDLYGELETSQGIYEDNQLHELNLSSFAWRPLNTLPDNPKFKYEVDIDAHSWRPLLDQSA
jgi:hypothetical protein